MKSDVLARERNPVAPTVKQQRHVVLAAYLGWTLDAFDFFIMVFVLGDIASEFGTDRTTVTWAITLTLAARPLGAWLFGRVADRFGRRPTLMLNVATYSVLEFASGFAPSLTVFIILRTLYGVAMGGEWGVGASLTMESIPARWRGAVSGLLQAGYPSGYLLATLLYRLGYASIGWRGMFMVGVVPALLGALHPAQRARKPGLGGTRRDAAQGELGRGARAARAADHLRRGADDGVQLLQPRHAGPVSVLPAGPASNHRPGDRNRHHLQSRGHDRRHRLSVTLSQRIGRRVTIVICALLALPVIPLWAFSSTALMLGLGAFLMQIFVQGAWGVIPAHLNELSPPEIRATFPGVVYQLGNLLASANATIQSSIADRMNHDLSWALAGVTGIVAVVIAVLVGFGREARDVRMGTERVPQPAE